MTQEQFDKLPGLLSLQQFVSVTGLTRHKIAEMIIAGVLDWHRGPVAPGRAKSYRKYYKRDAARLGGFAMR
jgi:hypothetical protein